MVVYSFSYQLQFDFANQAHFSTFNAFRICQPSEFPLNLYGIQTRILCTHFETISRCAAARFWADRRGNCWPFFAKILPQTVQTCALHPIHSRLTQIELLSGESVG